MGVIEIERQSYHQAGRVTRGTKQKMILRAEQQQLALGGQFEVVFDA
jgi:hypothetical protein